MLPNWKHCVKNRKVTYGRALNQSALPLSMLRIVHYEPTPETDVPLTQNGLFLTDTGGGYLEGSTDISRTFAFGELTQQMKEDFTTVLQCNFNLAHAVFLEGTTGYNLDVLARMPAWRRGINFNHGTGHDVGYLMNIHEASCGFRAIREKSRLL